MIGRALLHYEVIEKIGEGGMGVVYKARDRKLDRLVALKLLPSHVIARDGQERFVREAKAASALNHPNVCVIHAIEEHDGQTFIVMEYVDGQTLRQRLQDGPLPPDEVVGYALQIADALREAHAHGIIHRDIKTDNIMLNARGQIKVMDFGLAKLKGSATLTRASSRLGTPSYMAPEQIKGDELDSRADIFSFGAVLYELLTRRTPFRGESDAAVIYAILNLDPEPVQKYRSDLSSEFLGVLDRALEKDRKDRFPSMSDMLMDLQRLPESNRAIRPVPGVPYAESRRRHPWRVLGAGAGVVIAAVMLALLMLPKHKNALAAHRQVTFVGRSANPAISPDGQSLAYIVNSPDADDRVMVQDMAGGQPLEIFRFQHCQDLRWSPAGPELLVSALNDSIARTYVLPRLGGPARLLGFGNVRAWSPDGTSSAWCELSGKAIHIGRPGESSADSLVLPGAYVWLLDLDWSPRGDVIIALTQDSSGFSLRGIQRSGQRNAVIYRDSAQISCPRWAPGGDAIYFLRHTGQTLDLMRLAVGRDGLSRRGSPKGLLTGFDLWGNFTVSRDGRRLLCARGRNYTNLWIAPMRSPRDGRGSAARQLTHGTSEILGFSFSPDGKHIALAMGSIEASNIHALEIDTGSLRQITFLDERCCAPVWSPDGKMIAFTSGPAPGGNVNVVSIDGGARRRIPHTRLGDDYSLEWAPGSEILYHSPGNRNWGVLNPLTERERPLVPNDSVGWIFSPQYAPDGRHVAVEWNRPPSPNEMSRGLWILSLTDASQRHLPHDGSPLGWSPDGNWVYASGSWNSVNTVVRIAMANDRVEDVWQSAGEAVSGVDISPDAQRVAFTVPAVNSDIWLVENFDPAVR